MGTQAEEGPPFTGGWWLLTALAALDAADGLLAGTELLLTAVKHVAAVLATLSGNVAGTPGAMYRLPNLGFRKGNFPTAYTDLSTVHLAKQ